MGKKCARCGSTGILSLDRIKSLDAGGCSWTVNLQLLCLLCKETKGRDVVDYRPSHPWMEEHRKAHDALCEKHGGRGVDPRGKRARLIARYGEKRLACGETETLTIDRITTQHG